LCDALVGRWAWFTGGVVTMHANGTLDYANPDGSIVNTGTWECTDVARGRVTLRWRQDGYVNQVALSADGNGLSSTDPSQQFVTAKRIGAEAKAPAKKDASTLPPAPAQGGDAFLEGRRLAASGQCRDAIPYFNQAIQANPRYAKAYSDRGRCFAMLGQLDRGLQDLDRAVESAPNNMSPYFNRAGLRADAGDGDGALADLDRSIRIDPMNAAARAGLFEVMGWAPEAQLDADTAYRLVETFMPKKRPIVEQVLKTWRGKRVHPAVNAPPAGGAPLQDKSH
jgi:tetratricopeptide (TPR) repeat protein